MTKTVGFGYQTSGIATYTPTPIVPAPTLVWSLTHSTIKQNIFDAFKSTLLETIHIISWMA